MKMTGDVWADFEIELFPDTEITKKVTCKTCKQVVYKVSKKSTISEAKCERVGLIAHLEFSHGMVVLSSLICLDAKVIKL